MSNFDLATLTRKPVSRRRLVQGAAVAGAVAVLPGTARFAAAQNDKPLKIAFSVPALAFPFFDHMMDLAEAHAKELGNIELRKLDGGENGQPSSTKQSADLEAMISEKIDGVVISPNDANALAASIQAVIDAGITVVTVDRNVTAAKTLAHVGADNVRGGELQGEYLVKILPDGGNIYELEGQPGSTPAIDRHKGLHNVLDKQDKIKVIFDDTANFQRVEATSKMEAALAGKPKPDAVVCANDDMALGVATVAQDQGLSFPIIGFDSLPETLQAIQAGTVAATVEQFPGQQASTALDILVAYLRQGTKPKQHDNYLSPALITKDNLGQAERAAEAGITPAGTPFATPAS